MSDNHGHSDRGRHMDRRPRNSTTGKIIRIIHFLFFFLPRLVFWYAVKIIATAMLQLITLAATNAGISRQAEGKPVVESGPPIPDDTEQYLAEKRRRRSSAMEEWDHEWGQLSDIGPEQRAGGSGPSPEKQSAKKEPPNEPALSELDNRTEHVRGALQLRFHLDVVKLHAARLAQRQEKAHPEQQREGHPAPDTGIRDGSVVAIRDGSVVAIRDGSVVAIRDGSVVAIRDGSVVAIRDESVVAQHIPAGADTAPTDPEQLLANDPRTMWAWAEYKERGPFLPVSGEDARQILSAIPPCDHVEIFGAVTITEDYPKRSNNALPKEARFAARTFHSWILPSPGPQPETICASTTDWYASMGTSIVDYVAESHFSLPDDRHFYAYGNKETYKRFHDGAGRSILRLPDNPLAPAPPELGTTTPSLPTSESASPIRLIGDWHTAEDLALWHMSGLLGFFGSRLTGEVSDRGVDVEHPEAVAQVKMQANPVGSPQIRQLRGARPHLTNHVFYSTSGYTRAAIAEAAETGVALFTVAADATVRPYGAHAQRLILDGHRRQGGDDALVADYINSVTERIHKAKANYGSSDSAHALHEAHRPDWDGLSRAQNYLEGAVDAVKRHPRIGAETHKTVVSHFRNADLKAAFFCQALGLPYPGDEPLSHGRRHPTAGDFY